MVSSLNSSWQVALFTTRGAGVALFNDFVSVTAEEQGVILMNDEERTNPPPGHDALLLEADIRTDFGDPTGFRYVW